MDTFIINEGTYTKEGDVGITQNRVNIENRGTLNLDYGYLRADFRFIQTEDGILNLPIRDARTLISHSAVLLTETPSWTARLIFNWLRALYRKLVPATAYWRVVPIPLKEPLPP